MARRSTERLGSLPHDGGLRISRRLQGGELVAEAALDAAQQLDALGHRFTTPVVADGPTVLSYSPVARVNPFQSLLYSRAWEHGMAPIGLREFDDLARCPWPGRRVIHLHWLTSVVGDAATADTARARVQRFVELLQELRRDSCRIVWTMHNVLPHDCALPDVECELREAVVRAVDLVHTMHPGAVQSAAPYYSIPQGKLFTSPHPSYLGAYPDYVDRHTARYELCIRPTDFVFLLFGAIKAYKGVQELLEAFEILCRDVRGLARRPRLVIAGSTSDARMDEVLTRFAAQRDDTTLSLRKIPTEDVQYYFRAADVAVVPYRHFLNSGAAHLALSFGLPVVVPAVADEALLAAGFSFAPGDPESLADAMRRAIQAEGSERAEAAKAHATKLGPAQASDRFFEELRAGLARIDAQR